MKNILSVFSFVCFILFLSSCNRGNTTWEPEFAFPIAKGELSFHDLEDSNDYLQLDGEVIEVHYYDTLAPLDLNELINLGDTLLEAAYTPGIGIGPLPFENATNIFTLDEDFDFNLDGALLRYGKVRSGSLRVIFESDVDGYLDLTYLLTGIELDGEPLSLLGQTEPASAAEPFTDELIVDISGYTLDFTGASGIERNTLTGELSVATSNSPAYTAQVYGSNLVTVKLELLDLEIEELRGYFGQWEREIDEEIVLDSLIYQGGTVTLGELNASLEFINNFGVDAQVQLSELATLNSVTGNQVVLQTTELYNLVNISRAIETADAVIPSSVTFEFDETSNLAEALSVTPNRLKLQGDAILNPLGDVSGGFDFFLDEYPFQMVADISFPLCASIEDLTLLDTLRLDLEREENIKALTLTAVLKNSFELGFDVEMFLPGVPEVFWQASIIPEVDGEVTEHTITLELTESRLEEFYTASELIVKVVVNTTNSGEVKLLTADKIEILITGKATYGVEI
jgi:hypothetical protein